MTRERKLAIQMWEEVKRQLPKWYEEDKADKADIVSSLKDFKSNFCVGNDLRWMYDCWFCQYFRTNCDECPLRSCEYNDPLTAWHRIISGDTSLEIKLKACDDIITALKGGIDDR